MQFSLLQIFRKKIPFLWYKGRVVLKLNELYYNIYKVENFLVKRDKRNQKFKICGRGNIPGPDVKNEKKVDSLTQ